MFYWTTQANSMVGMITLLLAIDASQRSAIFRAFYLTGVLRKNSRCRFKRIVMV